MIGGAVITRSGPNGPVTLRMRGNYMEAQDPTTGRWSMVPYRFVKENVEDREATDWQVVA